MANKDIYVNMTLKEAAIADSHSQHNTHHELLQFVGARYRSGKNVAQDYIRGSEKHHRCQDDNPYAINPPGAWLQ